MTTYDAFFRRSNLFQRVVLALLFSLVLLAELPVLVGVWASSLLDRRKL